MAPAGRNRYPPIQPLHAWMNTSTKQHGSPPEPTGRGAPPATSEQPTQYTQQDAVLDDCDGQSSKVGAMIQADHSAPGF
jgi:hypothetical protein